MGAALAAAVSLLGYSGFSNSRLQILEVQQRRDAGKPTCITLKHIYVHKLDTKGWIIPQKLKHLS